MLRLLLTGILVAVLNSGAGAAPLKFNGLSGTSSMADVRRAFPMVATARLCQGESARFANGVTRCQLLRVASYKLAGYDFWLTFFFNEDGTLKSASLHWPPLEGVPKPSAQEAKNAYWALVELFHSKYGPAVEGSPCSLVGSCTEWQLDGTTVWHGGGERIEIQFDETPRFPDVGIVYTFVDTSSFNRF
jgi:hypothetical protein